MMNKQEVAQILAVLSAGFPNAQVTKETARVYFEVLSDLDAPQVSQAIGVLLRTSEWFPSAATIRKTTMELSGRLAPSSGDAWGAVVAEVSKSGLDGGCHIDDPVIKATVRAIGWRAICLSERQDVIRGQFVKMYEEMKRKADTQVLAGGLLELEA